MWFEWRCWMILTVFLFAGCSAPGSLVSPDIVVPPSILVPTEMSLMTSDPPLVEEPEPVCPPDHRQECDGQDWDSAECAWVGRCPEPEPEPEDIFHPEPPPPTGCLSCEQADPQLGLQAVDGYRLTFRYSARCGYAYLATGAVTQPWKGPLIPLEGLVEFEYPRQSAGMEHVSRLAAVLDSGDACYSPAVRVWIEP